MLDRHLLLKVVASSEMMARPAPWRRTLDLRELRSIDVREWARRGYLRPCQWFSWSWSRGGARLRQSNPDRPFPDKPWGMRWRTYKRLRARAEASQAHSAGTAHNEPIELAVSNAPLAVIAMSTTMEAAKLVTAGWLARRWRMTAAVWRVTLVALDCVDIGRRSRCRGRSCEYLLGKFRSREGDGGGYSAHVDCRAGRHAGVMVRPGASGHRRS
jgi:hypothetical protein